MFKLFFLGLVLCLCLTPAVSADTLTDLEEYAKKVSDALGADGAPDIFRRVNPRWGYPTVPSYSGSDLEKYGIGIGIQAGYGIVLAVLVLFTGLFFCCCRCCCNGCGGKEAEENGYSGWQRWGTFFIMVIFILWAMYLSFILFDFI